MDFGPSKNVGTGNQRDQLVRLENFSLIWFHLRKEFLLAMSF